MRKSVFIALTLISSDLFCQIPKVTNQINAENKRQGLWSIRYDSNWNITSDSSKTRYYRLIEYKDDRPVNIVRDYLASGKIQWEGFLTSDRPGDELDSVCTWYREDQTKEAQRLYRKAKIIKEDFFNLDGSRPKESWQSYNKKAYERYQNGSYREAADFFQLAREQAEKQFYKTDPHYSDAINNLATVVFTQGIYRKAEDLYLESLTLTEKSLGRSHPDYAISLNNLANLYTSQGLYTKAEPLLIEAKKIRESVFGNSSPEYAEALNNLGALYYYQGLYDKAKPLFTMALKIREQKIGVEHRDYLATLNNLASLNQDQGLLNEAELQYKQVLSTRERTLGKLHPDYAQAMSNLADLYKEKKIYVEAETLLIESEKIRAKTLGTDHPDYARTLTNLAHLYTRLIQYKRADSLYLKAKETYKKSLGTNHPAYAACLNGLALSYLDENLLSEAEPVFNEVVQNKLQQIQLLFPYFSEKERLAYLQSIRFFFTGYTSFVISYWPQKKAITGDLFNLQLTIKGLIFESVQSMRNSIYDSGDKRLIEQFENLRNQRDYLIKVWKMSNDEKKKQNIDEKRLEDETNELERELSKKTISSLSSSKTYKWQDVQTHLKKKEAAVEIIRAYKRNLSNKETMDTVYVALIITPLTKEAPGMVLFENGSDLEGKYLKYYRNSIKAQNQDDLSYNNFWKPIKDALGDVKKVYFSADGVFHQVNLLSLKNPITGKYVLDEINIRLVSNTKDIIQYARKPSKLNKKKHAYNAHLFGYPDYQGMQSSTSKGERSLEEETSLESDTTQRFFGLAHEIKPLPGTREETETIARLLDKNRAKVNLHLENNASEFNIKNLKSPKILHIATHGFFLQNIPHGDDASLSESSENKFKSNPLLRSGLLLAGAQKGLKGYTTDNEDGILTAQEAMNLSLINTELVLLSACETGLGEIVNGEGVFSLQRAFQQAGANTVIMSLWKVDDLATQRFMTLFYTHLLSGLEKKEAFKMAQEELRNNYPHPYYWGAFVIVGN